MHLNHRPARMALFEHPENLGKRKRHENMKFRGTLSVGGKRLDISKMRRYDNHTLFRLNVFNEFPGIARFVKLDFRLSASHRQNGNLVAKRHRKIHQLAPRTGSPTRFRVADPNEIADHPRDKIKRPFAECAINYPSKLQSKSGCRSFLALMARAENQPCEKERQRQPHAHGRSDGAHYRERDER